jgi:hypothetical protein
MKSSSRLLKFDGYKALFSSKLVGRVRFGGGIRLVDENGAIIYQINYEFVIWRSFFRSRMESASISVEEPSGKKVTILQSKNCIKFHGSCNGGMEGIQKSNFCIDVNRCDGSSFTAEIMRVLAVVLRPCVLFRDSNGEKIAKIVTDDHDNLNMLFDLNVESEIDDGILIGISMLLLLSCDALTMPSH